MSYGEDAEEPHSSTTRGTVRNKMMMGPPTTHRGSQNILRSAASSSGKQTFGTSTAVRLTSDRSFSRNGFDLQQKSRANSLQTSKSNFVSPPTSSSVGSAKYTHDPHLYADEEELYNNNAGPSAGARQRYGGGQHTCSDRQTTAAGQSSTKFAAENRGQAQMHRINTPRRDPPQDLPIPAFMRNEDGKAIGQFTFYKTGKEAYGFITPHVQEEDDANVKILVPPAGGPRDSDARLRRSHALAAV
ncbi:unnamed protein product [Amoebophrya sp. A120]|nr:unnamed protein product [Amoebophrya sp. A120]|eukprot:GSA120T00021198001.1